MGKFKFELGAEVTLNQSGESGAVIARAEYLESESAYLVRYKAADGRQTEAWWSEGAFV